MSHSKVEQRYRDFPHPPCHREHLHGHVIITQRPRLTLGTTLGLERSVGLDKRMTRIHRDGILWTGFAALKICAPPIPPSLPGHPDLFAVSTALPFPECHMVGIKQSASASDWLLSRSAMLLRFLHVFSWLDSSFLFSADSPVSGFTHSPTQGYLGCIQVLAITNTAAVNSRSFLSKELFPPQGGRGGSSGR